MKSTRPSLFDFFQNFTFGMLKISSGDTFLKFYASEAKY